MNIQFELQNETSLKPQISFWGKSIKLLEVIINNTKDVVKAIVHDIRVLLKGIASIAMLVGFINIILYFVVINIDGSYFSKIFYGDCIFLLVATLAIKESYKDDDMLMLEGVSNFFIKLLGVFIFTIILSFYLLRFLNGGFLYNISAAIVPNGWEPYIKNPIKIYFLLIENKLW